jgi:hypothetical protein
MHILSVILEESKSIDYERACPYNGINTCMASITSLRLGGQKRQIVLVRKTMMTAQYTCQSY